MARVKRRGKSPPAPVATREAAHPMRCKAKYTGSQGLLVHCRGVGCYSAPGNRPQR